MRNHELGVYHRNAKAKSLLQIVYTSVASRLLDPVEMADLCERSGQNNRRDEITGFLLTKAGKYLQALEGPKEPVEDAFIRIIQDGRHSHMLVLSRRLTTWREFGQWEMACYQDLTQHKEIADRIATHTKLAPYTVQKVFTDLLATIQ